MNNFSILFGIQLRFGMLITDEKLELTQFLFVMVNLQPKQIAGNMCYSVNRL